MHLRLSLFLLFFTLSSCSSLQTPEFRRPSSYTAKTNTQSKRILDEAFRLTWPMKGARLTRGFAPRWKNHYGLDLAQPLGSPIYAAHSGVVVYSGYRHYRGYGKLIIVEHPSGWASMYAHCNDLLVKQGEIVKIGQKIATVGRTGNARGVHLHFELRKDKKAVDPARYLP